MTKKTYLRLAIYGLVLVLGAVTASVLWKGDSSAENEKLNAIALQRHEKYAKQAADERARLTPASGIFIAATGKATDPFHAVMTLDLQSDGTITLTNEMSNRRDGTGKMLKNVAIGSWNLDADTVTVELEQSPDGRPIPDDDKKLEFKVVKETAAGPITSLEGVKPKGPNFIRQ